MRDISKFRTQNYRETIKYRKNKAISQAKWRNKKKEEQYSNISIHSTCSTTLYDLRKKEG